MKRIVSLLLLFTIVSTSYLPAYAGSLNLPKSLVGIDEEAFYEDMSLDEIMIPYGTTYIGSKAFAYTSAVSIHIPVTVDSIAEDTFLGSPDIVICSPSYAYAKLYAETHNLTWEEDNTFDLKNELASYDQIIEFDEDTFVAEAMEIPEYLSSGTTDPEFLAAIEAYNAINVELMMALEESNDSMQSVLNSINILANDMQTYFLAENNGVISFDNGEYEYEMSTPSFNGIREIATETAYTVENGSIQIEIDNGGVTSYMVLKDGSFCITDDAVLVSENTNNKTLLSRAAHNEYGIDFVESIVKKVQGLLDQVGIAISGWKAKRAISVDLAKNAWEKAITIGDIDEIEAAYSRYWKAQRALAAAETFSSKFAVKCVPILGLIATAKTDIEAWKKLDSYTKHGHPTDRESNDEVALSIINKINRDIGIGKTYFIADASVAVIGAIAQTQAAIDWLAAVVTVAVPGLGQIVAAKATLELIVSLVSVGAGAVLSILGEKKLQAVEENDALLHNRVTGVVKDAISGEAISDVLVKSGQYSTRTNSTGKYILRIDGDCLSFSKKGYVPSEKNIDTSYAGTLMINEELYLLCTVSGFVQNIGGHPLVGAKVYCNTENPHYKNSVITNENGFYSIKVPMGTRTLYAECALCSPEDKTISITERTNNCNFILNTMNYSVGSIVIFGQYDQDNDISNGKEPIEWILIEKSDNTMTLISKFGLDSVPYNEVQTNISWEGCTLRKWLNNDFLNAAFTIEEQAKLQTVTVKAEDNPIYGTEAGNDTLDKVYLLSINEAETLLHSDGERLCIPTKTAARLVYVYTNGAAESWLRSPGWRQDLAAETTLSGVISHNSYVFPARPVRPVICLKLP